MKHVHFIINPIAGSGKNTIDESFIREVFDNNEYDIVLKYTTHKKQAILLTQDSIKEGAFIVVACGGDGTINEVASCLVNTSIPLGIIPLGSGNGLASNLKIPKNIHKAIYKIYNQNIEKIDVGKFNNNYFFSNSGVGFDAKVVNHYENANKRRLSAYIKASLKSLRELNYDNEIEITINGNSIKTKPFMIFVSNSNELGYNVSLTPKASLKDGLLDVLIIHRLSKIKTFLFGLLMLFKKQHLLKEVESFQSNNIKINQFNSAHFQSQIDGEYHLIESSSIKITVLAKSLNIIV